MRISREQLKTFLVVFVAVGTAQCATQRGLMAGIKRVVRPVLTQTTVPATPVDRYTSGFATLAATTVMEPAGSSDVPTGPMHLPNDSTALLVQRCGQWTRMRLSISAPAVPLDSGTIGGVYCGSDKAGVKDIEQRGDTLYVSTHLRAEGGAPGIHFGILAVGITAAGRPLGTARRVWVSPTHLDPPVMGAQAGGRMLLHGDHHLLLVQGDHGRADRAQEPLCDLGKVLEIDVQSGTHQVRGTGLRSPGGLTRDGTGQLWNTDHGPMGGDEVNLLRDGRNYGWPVVSYGTVYSEGRPPTYYGNRFGQHQGFEAPRYVFMTAVAPGVLATFPANHPVAAWRGDLVVGALKTGSVIRLRREEDRLVYAETIFETRQRIRDLGFLSSGDLLLWLEPGSLVRLHAVTAE